jgi:hypothetical protein
MARRSSEKQCKVCGAVATVKRYSSKGRNGKVYRYEKFSHRNGVVHYYRIGRDTTKMTISDAFAQMIDTKVGDGKYRFKDFKTMFEAIYGSPVSNTTISRNLAKSIKLNLIDRKTEGNTILYSRKLERDVDQQLKISNASMSYLISKNRASIIIFLHFGNPGNQVLTKIPVTLPIGIVEPLHQLSLKAFDQVSEIPPSGINITYSYAGQTGISIVLNRPLKPNESDFIFLNGNFEVREKFLKFALPFSVDNLRINVDSGSNQEIIIRKRLLDGLKESNPEIVRRGKSGRGGFYTEVVFENATKGEGIVITFGEENLDR